MFHEAITDVYEGCNQDGAGASGSYRISSVESVGVCSYNPRNSDTAKVIVFIYFLSFAGHLHRGRRVTPLLPAGNVLLDVV